MKTITKLLAILTIMLVAFTALVPNRVQAVGENLTLTVTAPEGVADEVVTNKEIHVYKLFDLTVENGIYTYSWENIEATKDFFTAKGYDTIVEATEYVRDLSGTALTVLAEEYYQFCQTHSGAVVYKSESGESKVFTGLDKGFYLVYDVQAENDDTAKSVAILRNLEVDTEVELKIETVEVEKTVDKTNANVGDTVEFTVSSTVPDTTGYTKYTFIVNDTMSKGLDFNNDVVINIGGEEYARVIEVEDEETGAVVEVERYTVSTTGKTELTIEFDEIEFLKLTAGDEIEITYSATLNVDSATEIENSNEVTITYSNDPTTDSTGETEEKKTYVYTYAVDFTKKNTKGQALEGAQFVLKYTDEENVTKYVKFVDGKVTYVDDLAEATVYISDENGAFSIAGLKEGSYTLVETVAPEGYSLPSFDGFTFTISETLDANGKLVSATFDYTADANNIVATGYMPDSKTINGAVAFEIDVLNAKGTSLPTTGGMGTTIFTIAGIVVMAVAGIALVIRNRKND